MKRPAFDFPLIKLDRICIPEKSIFVDQIQALLGSVNQVTGRRNRPSIDTEGKRRDGANLLIQGLYQCHRSKNPQAALVVPASPRAFKHGDSGRIEIIGHKISESLVKTMDHLGWINITKGFRDGENNVPTVIRPAGDLLAEFETVGYVWQKLTPPPTNMLVRMKNYDPATRESFHIPPPENDKVRLMRSQLRKINQFLGSHAIALMVKDSTLEDLGRQIGRWRGGHDRKPPTYVDFQSVYLRRIFARSSLEYGGRAYGGWWQSVPKEMRVHITINGQATCEIDFSALHPSLIHHREGYELPSNDIYTLDLPAIPGIPDEELRLKRRGIVKEFVNAMLNDERNEFKLSKEGKELLGMTNAKLRKLLEKNIPVVAKHFGSGIGLKLQKIDSDIAAVVMRILMEKNIVCLPVHDSFIVPIFHRHDLKQAMIDAYINVMGRSINFKEISLFDNDASGKRKVPPEFALLFDPTGKVDAIASMKAIHHSWHNQYLSSYLSQQSGKSSGTAQQKSKGRTASMTIK